MTTCIISSFNEDKRIGYVLQRLMELDDLEIIVVGDGSSDDTKKIVEKKVRKVKFI